MYADVTRKSHHIDFQIQKMFLISATLFLSWYSVAYCVSVQKI
jgi:hypothetical protein